MSENWLESARKKREEEQQKNSSGGTEESWLESARKKRFEDDVNKVDDSYINTFMDYANRFTNSAEEEYGNVGWGNASSAYLNRQTDRNNLDYRRSVIQAWLEAHKDQFDENGYRDFYDSLDRFSTDSAEIVRGFSELRDYFSQFASEEDYKAFLNRPMTSQEAAQGEQEMREKLESYRSSDKRAEDAEEASQQAAESLRFDPASFDLQLMQLPGWGLNQEELGYEKAIDYYVQQGKFAQDRELMEQDVQEIQAMGEEWQKLFDSYMVSRYDLDNPNAAANTAAIRNQLYKQFGAERAEELAESWSRYQTSEASAQVREWGESHADSGWLGQIAASGATVFANAMGTLTAPLGYLIEAGGRTGRYHTLDPNNPGAMPGQYASTVRSGIAEHIEGEEPGIVRKGLSYLYQGGMSAADNLVRIAMGGGSEIGSLGLAALGSFGSTLSEVSAKGGTPAQAVLMGVATAGLEVLTEKISLDNLFDAAEQGAESVWDVMKAAFKSAGVEVSEEELSFLGSLAAEAVILREESDYNRTIHQLMERGMSREEAETQASRAIWQEALDTAITSAISGGMMAGVTGGINYASANHQKKATAASLEEASQKYGAQAKAMVHTYQAGQDVKAFDSAYRSAFDMGKSGVELEYVKNSETVSYLTEQQVENAHQAGVAAAGGLEASDNGKAQLKSSGETVTIGGIASMDGGMKLSLGDGQMVDAKDVRFATQEEATVYQAVAGLSVDAQTAQALVDGYDSGGVISAADYAIGIKQAYRYGQKNLPAADMLRSEYISKLTAGQRTAAYEAGQKAGQQEAQAAQKAVAGKQKSGGEGGSVKFRQGGTVTDLRSYLQENGKTLSDTQETAVRTMEQLSAALGVDMYVYESYENDQGKRVYLTEEGKEASAPNGRYCQGGRIYIDLNAGVGGKGTMLYTVAHELTHFIREWSPEKFQVLADTLMEGYAREGQSVSALVEAQIRKARKNGRTIDFDTAFEEVVADSMEDVLTSGRVTQLMAEVKQQDRGLWQKIRDWFRSLAEDIRALVKAYQGHKPDSAEGRMVAQMQEVLPVLEQCYADALADASESYKAAPRTEKNTTREGDAEYEAAVKRSDRIVDQIHSSLPQIMALDSVCAIDSSNATPYTANLKEDENSGHAVFKAQGGFANRPGFGRVVLGKKGAVSTVFHGNGPAKQAAFPAIKSVIEQGIEIGRDYNHNGKGFDTVTFAAPVNFFGAKAPLGVVVKVSINGRGDKSFYIHEICDAEGNYIQLEDGVLSKKEISSTGLVDSTSTAGTADDGISPKTSIRNESENVNEKFSERDPEVEKAYKRLEKENGKLREDVEHLKEMLKLQKIGTQGKKFTRSSVDAAAKVLMEQTDAQGTRKELAGLLNGLYEHIAGSEELTWESVKEAAQPAVDWLQGHKRQNKQLDGFAREVLTDIRGSKVYLDESQQQEAAHFSGSFNEYRRGLFGSVTVTKSGGVSLDQQWQEWSVMYPSVFDPNISASDMPRALAEAVKTLRGMRGSEYAGELLAEQEVLRQVYDSYWNVSTLYTVADKKQKEISRLKYEHSQRMTELRTRNSENRQKAEERRMIRRRVMDLKKLLKKGGKKAGVKEDMKDLVGKTLDSADFLLQDHHSDDEIILRGFTTRLSPQEAEHARKAQALLNWLESAQTGQLGDTAGKESQLAYRKSQLRDALVRERLEMDEAKASQMLGDLADAYKQLENSEQRDVKGAFDENVHQRLLTLREEVGGATVKNMSLAQLHMLREAYTMVLTTVRKANETFAKNIQQTRTQLAEQVISEIRKAGGETLLRMKGMEKVNSFSWNNLKPVYAFERLGSETFKKLFNNVRAGEDTWARDMNEARDFWLRVSKKHGYESWDMKQTHSFRSGTGKAFQLNLEQIMSLYAYSRRDQAQEHLLKGGFVFDGETEVQVNKRGIKLTYLVEDATAYKLTLDTLAQIVDTLTAEQKAFVEEMQEYLSADMGGKGNEVSMELYGVKQFGEQFYFPLRSAGQYLERAKSAEDQRQQGQVNIVNSGFTKTTKPKASNPVVLSGFTEVWAEHVNDMSMYHGFALPMEDFRRVFNYSSPHTEEGQSVSVNSTIQNAYGAAAVQYIDQLYKDLNGGAVSDPRETTGKALMSKFKKAAVFASLSVAAQQPSAIGRAFAVIDPKYFVGEKIDHKRHKQLWEEVKRYAPVAVIKEMGYFDTGMGRSGKDFLLGKEYEGLKAKAVGVITDESYRDEVLGKLPALLDEATWCAIWQAAKRETRAKHPGLSVKSEEFLTLAGERFTEVITKTQVYDSTLSRSANMRSKSAFMSMWTAFMGEPTTTINMMEDALRKGLKGDVKFLARTTGAVFGSIVLNSLLSSFVYAMRDDDEDETFLEKYVQSVAVEILDGINPLTYYPLLKDIWSVFQGYDIERSDMSLIADLADSMMKLAQLSSKDTDGMTPAQLEAHEQKLKDAWWGLVDYTAALGGIPVKNVRRDVNGIFNFFKAISRDLNGDNSMASLMDKTWDQVRSSIPVIGFMGSETMADKLYDATVNGQESYRQRLESAYADESSLNTAIRKGLRENDTRIWEAAIAWNENDLETYMKLAKEIVGEGNFSQDNVVLAIRAEAAAMLPDEESESSPTAKSYFTMEKFTVAAMEGKTSLAATIREDILATAQKNGKTLAEAESSFRSSLKSEVKDLFLSGDVTRQKATALLTQYHNMSSEEIAAEIDKWQCQKDTGIPYADIGDAFQKGEITLSRAQQLYMKYGGMTQEEAEAEAAVLSFVKQNPGLSDITSSAVEKYNTYCQSAEVSPRVFYDAWKQKGSLTGSGEVKEPMLQYIDSLDLTAEQKDALYLSFGWAESGLRKTPWH